MQELQKLMLDMKLQKLKRKNSLGENMNAIEIRGLKKSFRGMYALNGLNMNVPVGSIYGFIGENGSGKSTTEKLICGHLVKDSGTIKLFGKDYTDPGVRVRVGALIENAGCFPGSSIYTNLKMQCLNLGIQNADEEISRVLQIVRMEEHRELKFICILNTQIQALHFEICVNT